MMIRMVYVLDPVQAEGYLFRAPVFVARWFCRRYRGWGYASSPEGD